MTSSYIQVTKLDTEINLCLIELLFQSAVVPIFFLFHFFFFFFLFFIVKWHIMFMVRNELSLIKRRPDI